MKIWKPVILKMDCEGRWKLEYFALHARCHELVPFCHIHNIFLHILPQPGEKRTVVAKQHWLGMKIVVQEKCKDNEWKDWASVQSCGMELKILDSLIILWLSLHWKSYLELIEDSLICMANPWYEQREGSEKLVRRKFIGQLCHNL